MGFLGVVMEGGILVVVVGIVVGIGSKDDVDECIIFVCSLFYIVNDV